MTPLSERIAKLEQRLNKRLERWKAKHSADWRLYAVLGGMGWYFYGMIVNSVRLGIRQSFDVESDIASIWVVNPFRNLIAPFTLTGLGLTAALLVLACLLTRRGFNWLSGYHPVHDKRGFDILPDGTHGTSRFMKPEEMKAVLETGRLDDLTGTIYGKHRDDPLDDNRFSLYIASSSKSGLAGNMLVIGAPGTGKSWGFVRPMIFQCVKRRESMILTDPKAELYESTAGYLADMGYEVRVFNLLEMEHSDRWNCIGEADYDERLIPIIAATIINNTSSEKEAGDFWAKAELNLLTALLYYVQNDKDVSGNVLPLSQRRLGRILSLLTDNGLATIDREIKLLPRRTPGQRPLRTVFTGKGEHMRQYRDRSGQPPERFSGQAGRRAHGRQHNRPDAPRTQALRLFLYPVRTGSYLRISVLAVFHDDIFAAGAVRAARNRGRQAAGAGQFRTGRVSIHRQTGRFQAFHRVYTRFSHELYRHRAVHRTACRYVPAP